MLPKIKPKRTLSPKQMKLQVILSPIKDNIKLQESPAPYIKFKERAAPNIERKNAKCYRI